MKILWLSHLVPYPPKGGVLQRSYHLVHELAKYHDIYLLAFNQPDLMRPMFASVEAGLDEAQIELSKYCKAVKILDIPCEQQRYGKPLLGIKTLWPTSSYTVGWLQSDEYKQAVIEWKNEHTFDLVHADTISLMPYLDLFSGVKTSLDHHNIESHMMLRRAKLEPNWIKKLYFYQEGWKLQRYEKKVCPKVDINITCSVLDSDRLKSFCDIPHVVDIPNGVDVDHFAPDEESIVANSLIFAGRLNAYTNKKAVTALVEDIWPRLREEVPGVRLDIVGSSPPLAVINAAENDSTITAHGFVDDVRLYIGRAALYICPITDGGGTKLKILDALAMGKVIIGNPEAFEGIDVEHMKNAVIVDSVDGYVSQIKMLLADQAKIDQISREARLLVEREYSYDKIGKLLAAQYEAL